MFELTFLALQGKKLRSNDSIDKPTIALMKEVYDGLLMHAT